MLNLPLNLQWIPRLVHSDNSPRTIRQIHEDAAKEYGFYIPIMQPSANSLSSLFSDEHARLGLARNNKNGGMDDVFDSILMGMCRKIIFEHQLSLKIFIIYLFYFPQSNIGTGNLGVGPGVITADAYGGYSSNIGRVNRGGV